MEIWKTTIENYEISNLGNVRKKTKDNKYKKIKGSVQNRGYLYFQLQREGKRHNFLFHHLVAKEFIGERPVGLVIDHIDQNKLNNKLENLRYVTQQINMTNHKRYNKEITTTDKKERHKIQDKKYRDNNKEKEKIRHKKYYEKNKALISEKQKIYLEKKKSMK